jgi:hypothetical protein
VSLGGQHLGQAGGSQKPLQLAMSYNPNSFGSHVLVSSPQGPPSFLQPQVGVDGHFGHVLDGLSAQKQFSQPMSQSNADGQSTLRSSPQFPPSPLHLHGLVGLGVSDGVEFSVYSNISDISLSISLFFSSDII